MSGMVQGVEERVEKQLMPLSYSSNEKRQNMCTTQNQNTKG